MNFNFDAINSILTRKHGDVSSIKVLKWHVNDITELMCNNFTTQVSRLIIYYRILGENNDSATKQEICFVKMPAEGFLFKWALSMDLYNREILIYTMVLPQMYSIEKEHMTPRLCYFDDKMTLALKDLSQSGYKCADRVQKLDVEHCICALKCLAKFHALSVKLEKTTGLPDTVKSNPYCNLGADKLNKKIAEQMPRCIDSVPQNLKEMYPNFVSHLNTLSAETIINALNDSSSSKLNVLIHGDLSINNIMFKYDKYGIVRKAKLIDLQFTRWSSPAIDLLYFFITCTKFEIYLRYFPLLMDVYFDALNKVLRQLDCPKYDMRSVLKEMDTLYPYALYVLSCILPCIICDPNIVADSKGFLENVYKQDHYREISVKWCEHLAKKGTLRIDEEHHSD